MSLLEERFSNKKICAGQSLSYPSMNLGTYKVRVESALVAINGLCPVLGG